MFSLTGNQLTIELTNTAAPTSRKYVDTDVLTGVFFSAEPQDMAPQSAVAPKVVDAAGTPRCLVDCDTGAGWEFNALTTPQFGMMNGISAVEMQLYLYSNFSSGKQEKLGGTSFGVVPNTYPDSKGSLLDGSGYAVGSTTFTVIAPDSFTLATLNRIAFMWGTSADNMWAYGGEGFFVGTEDETPEPASWILSGAALVLVGLARRARRHT